MTRTRAEYDDDARTSLQVACEQLPDEDGTPQELHYNLTCAIVYALLAVARAIVEHREGV